MRILNTLLTGQKKLKTIEIEFDVRVIEDIDFKVCNYLLKIA